MDIIQVAFIYGRLLEEFAWQTVVLTSKGNGWFKGIRPVEILCKALLGVVSQRIEAAVQFHDVLHGFRAGRGA